MQSHESDPATTPMALPRPPGLLRMLLVYLKVKIGLSNERRFTTLPSPLPPALSTG